MWEEKRQHPPILPYSHTPKHPHTTPMDERHEHEQYFFDRPTLARLADVVAQFENPCCLCAPMLGAALVDRDVAVSILDLDKRFASLPGYRRYDLRRSELPN